MEFRQLEAFVVLATELHFGRAAEKLHMSQPTLSELIRRLEREIGTPLLTRTTRRVALTGAGVELMARAEAIVNDVSAASEAVRRVATGEIGTVRLGVVPNAEPVLAPHIIDAMRRHAPEITVDIHRMWPPDLLHAVSEGTVDAAITCGYVADPPSIAGEVFCGEGVLVALRSTHRLADRSAVTWPELTKECLGLPSRSLFPDWHAAQQRVLEKARINPPTAELETIDVGATGWARQSVVQWVMTGADLHAPDDDVRVLPMSPTEAFVYKLQWNTARTQTAALARFVQLVLTVDVPPGWLVQPGHLRFAADPPPTRSEQP
ncbi:LysR family transcriptional regulator [Mycobacterium sp.]|uniref:LysR substrate-binding domain-containing protein n=1 Tax=Mycobacterium sp. TaxID=1785 RepID=UPI0025D7ABCF|nr:LysR family transcriptional regulator [Mycobacterium sp.]